MSIFERIAIGCANWNKPYNGSQLSDKEIDQILGYCQCSGIDTLDMATAYGNDFSRPNSYFNKIIKVQNKQELVEVVQIEPYCIMAHSKEIFDSFLVGYTHSIREKGMKTGVSLYCPEDSNNNIEGLTDIIQIPYSLYDRRSESWMEYMSIECPDIEIHVRSIFLRGKIIEDGIPAEEAIKFVLANPFVDKIIIGADSFDQLRRNLDFIFKWNNLEKHDIKLLDTRRWE